MNVPRNKGHKDIRARAHAKRHREQTDRGRKTDRQGRQSDKDRETERDELDKSDCSRLNGYGFTAMST